MQFGSHAALNALIPATQEEVCNHPFVSISLHAPKGVFG